MATATSTLIEQQVRGFNDGNIDDVVAGYADDVEFVLVSPHTLPGSELRLAGHEKVTRHMQRVLDGGISGVTVDWVGEGDGFLAWHDHGTFGSDTAFSEAHIARVNGEGRITYHMIHSLYAK